MALLQLLRKAKIILLSSRYTALNSHSTQEGTRAGSIFFQEELQKFLCCDLRWLEQTAKEYLADKRAWQFLSSHKSPSRQTDGFAKSVDVAEGFAIWAFVKRYSPQVVVEIGSQYGISARLWKEALKTYVPDHELILCDLEDNRRFISKSECIFLKGDARETLPKLFSSRSIDVLINDAHPYDLVKWSVEEGLKHKVTAFAFHDIGCKHKRGPFKMESNKLSTEDKMLHSSDWAQYGLWERHVMAEIFAQEILYVDAVETLSFRVQVFDSLFGFGFALNKGANS